MTHRNFFITATLLAGFVLGGTLANAQAHFTFDTGINGSVNVGDADNVIGANGSAHFYDNGTYGHDLFVTLNNYSSGDDFNTAILTGFYILKPWTSENTEAPAAEADTVGFELTSPNPTGWGTDTNGFNNVINEWDDWNTGSFPKANDAEYLFMSASADANDGIPNDSSTWGFNFDLIAADSGVQFGDIDWQAYLDSEIPHVFLRWQRLEDDREVEVFGGSAKGYTYFQGDFPIIPVPEPSEIAVVALLGLGGILMVRRRFSGKSNKTN